MERPRAGRTIVIGHRRDGFRVICTAEIFRGPDGVQTNVYETDGDECRPHCGESWRLERETFDVPES